MRTYVHPSCNSCTHHATPQDAVNCQGTHHNQLHLHHARASTGTLLGAAFCRVRRHHLLTFFRPHTTSSLQGGQTWGCCREHQGMSGLRPAPLTMCTSVTVKGDLRHTKRGYRAPEPRSCCPWSCQRRGQAWGGEPPTPGLRPDCTASVADRALAFMAMDPHFEEQG